MSTNNENINLVNISYQKENRKESNNNFFKEAIKVNLNPKINKINKGLKELDINCDLNHKQNNQNENKVIKGEEINKFELTKDNIDAFVNNRESDNLLLKYGEESYFYNKLLEKTVFKIPESILQNHKITSIVRTKMIDWMIEVISKFNYMEETFFLSVNILDIFLQKTKKILCNNDIHLMGITVMFTSSKFQEIYPQSLKNFAKKVGHDMFSVDEIKNMESEILSDVGLEVLVSTSIYDFLKTYFYDFYYNNKILIEKNCDINLFKDIMTTANYLSKLLVHYEYFYVYENSVKAIGCVISAIKLNEFFMKAKFKESDSNVYNQWILFLSEQDNFDKNEMENLVNKISLAFNHYQKSKSISRNLNKFMKLPFYDMMIDNKKK